MTIREQHAAALAQRHAWRGVTQTHLDRLDALHTDRHDRERAGTVTRTVSCASCGHMGITPASHTWDEADGWLDGTGWTDIDTHPVCPECSQPGGAA